MSPFQNFLWDIFFYQLTAIILYFILGETTWASYPSLVFYNLNKFLQSWQLFFVPLGKELMIRLAGFENGFEFLVSDQKQSFKRQVCLVHCQDHVQVFRSTPAHIYRFQTAVPLVHTKRRRIQFFPPIRIRLKII